MYSPLTEVESLARRHRSRRWIVRISVALLLGIVLLVVAAFLLTSSSLSIEEAKACYVRFSGQASREEVEKVFGVPSAVRVEPNLTLIMWCFFKHSFDKTECYFVVLALQDEDRAGQLGNHQYTYTGRDAWLYRWFLLKLRLGLQVVR